MKLKTNKSVVSVNLMFNELGVEEMRVFSDALSANHRIMEINLYGNRILK
jgi:hypothetical protein